MKYVFSDAHLSEDGLYRYELRRVWDPTKSVLRWIMLNPSTASGLEDDPTIRRCVAFAERWGFGGIVVVNLFALRATDPDELKAVDDPVGPHNIAWLVAQRPEAQRVVGIEDVALLHLLNSIDIFAVSVAAWGAHETAKVWWDAANFAGNIFGRSSLRCLGTTKSGMPRHPLYIKSSQHLEIWSPPA